MVAGVHVQGGLLTAIADLYALQELDLAIESRRAAIADTQSLLEEPEELAEARAAAEARRAALREAEAVFKDREYEADALRAKIEPLERKLYAGSVLNPKELADLQKDIESLKRHRSELEDRALEAMEALEGAQREAADAEERLREMTKRYQDDKGNALSRAEVLEQELADLEGRRAERAATVEPGLMQLYDRLAAIRQRRAVAKVEGGACQGCRISLPTNLIQRARSGNAVVQCSSCERILYVT
jgi:hypothetical protein